MGTGSLSLLDYRRRVAQLYADVRRTAAQESPRAAHDLWRAARDELYATHPDTPLLPDDPRRRTGLPVAPYDPDLRLAAAVEPADPTEPGHELRVTTGTDGEVVFTRLGRAATPLGTLDLWWLSGYGGGVWLPVRDGSSGTSSYGGGRYLLDTVKGADLGAVPGSPQQLVLDLNFLYNPSCAYDPGWACPLAPPGNRLGVAVEAGELA
ncbi:DUF1684 domain-containing protein [Quadrisphaera sp. KR29]|uniref:DUF1684 domain-containing protein n=1 Tax=Quadrisphaera sp. KR29 TaxID=3461391 RepID=UPI0040445A18